MRPLEHSYGYALSDRQEYIGRDRRIVISAIWDSEIDHNRWRKKERRGMQPTPTPLIFLMHASCPIKSVLYLDPAVDVYIALYFDCQPGLFIYSDLLDGIKNYPQQVVSNVDVGAEWRFPCKEYLETNTTKLTRSLYSSPSSPATRIGSCHCGAAIRLHF